MQFSLPQYPAGVWSLAIIVQIQTVIKHFWCGLGCWRMEQNWCNRVMQQKHNWFALGLWLHWCILQLIHSIGFCRYTVVTRDEIMSADSTDIHSKKQQQDTVSYTCFALASYFYYFYCTASCEWSLYLLQPVICLLPWYIVMQFLVDAGSWSC